MSVVHVCLGEALPLLTSPKRQQASSRTAASPAWRFRMRPSLEGVHLRTIAGTVGARVAASFLGFGAGVITARELGPHGRATLALMIAVPAIFSVVGVLGLDNANARFAGRSHSAFRQIVRRSFIFSAVAGPATAAAWWYAGSVWPAMRLGLDPRLAVLSAGLCPVSLLVTLLGTAEIGRGRVGVYNLVITVTSTAYLAGALLLLTVGRLTVIGCFAASAASQLLAAVLLLVLANTQVHADGERIALRRYSSYAFRAYLPNLAQYGMLRMDIPVIQVLAGTAAVALYAVALPVAEILMLLPTAVALVMFPQVTSGAVDRAAADRIGHAVLAITAVLAGAVALAAPVVIPAVYGVPYRGAVVVVWCMLPGLVFFSAGRMPQAYLAATDKLRLVIVATAAGVAAGLAGLLALTPRFGSAGAGAADSIGYLAFTMVVLSGLARECTLRKVVRRFGWLCRAQGRRAKEALTEALTPMGGWFRPTVFGALAAMSGVAAGLASTHGLASLVVLLTAVAVILIVVQPNAGLVVLAIAFPASQTTLGASLITEKDLVIVLVACLTGRLAAGRAIPPKPGPTALAVALVGYLLLSATLADGGRNAGQGWRAVLYLGAPLLCLPLIAGCDRATRGAIVIFSLSAACLAVVEIGKSHASLAAVAGTSAAESAVVAAGQTGAVDHNSEGAIFVLALAILLGRLPRTRSPIEKLILAVAVVALVVGIAYSFSRSAYFGALAVIVLFAARRSVRDLLGTAIAISALAFALPAAVSARLGTVWHSGNLDASSGIRIDLWSSALRIFDAHPLLGVGYLNFAANLPAYFIDTGSYGISIVQFSQLDFAHNTYLTVIAETGLVGAGLVAALVVLGWRRAWAAARSGDWVGEGAVLGLAGMGVCSAFGEVLLVPAILAALLLVILATHRSGGGALDRATLEPGAGGNA